MASIIPGFEYDIFISYRHKDNKGDQWVTEFVSALKTELESTFKEDVFIYFDSNPHDGLLETHIVDKSLQGKLNCLIFIPIISQTYCDIRSFAWQNEFCAFNKSASESQLGRDIKLNNGNVTSRILPVRIHDLDAHDKAILEKEFGGVLRAIDFIYKEAGVNRPLKITDSRTDNQNRTDYRNQVNKVANAIKEIIYSLNHPATAGAQTSPGTAPLSHKRSSFSRRTLITSAFLLSLIVLAVFLYPQLSSSNKETALELSVAVLPFVDMSEKRDQEWFSDGLTEEILNSLANLHELKVTARTSSFYFKGKDVSLQEMAEKLGVANIVEGSVRRIDNRWRVTAQLIRARDGFHIWAKTYENSSEDLFNVQSEISEDIARSLLKELNPESKSLLAHTNPVNIEAYEQYQKGLKIYYLAHVDFDISQLPIANEYFEKAISMDSSIGYSYYFMSDLYIHRLQDGNNQTAREDQYQTMHGYLDKAIRLSSDSTRTKFLKVTKCLQSDNWTDLSGLLSSFIHDPRAPKVASETGIGVIVNAFVLLKKEDDLYKLCEEALKIDPLNPILWQWAAMSLKDSNPKKALEILTNGEAILKTHFGYRSYIETGKTPPDMIPLSHPELIDKLPYGHLILMNHLTNKEFSSEDLKFTPNFATRLRELKSPF